MGAYENSLSEPLAYVPDNNFEQALIDLGYDNAIDDYVQISNVDGLTFIDLSGKEISNLTGIEHFINLSHYMLIQINSDNRY